ncbi:MAG TPA: hypothetical protein V6D25_20765 [Leptolyngbyaceae cyanobacterium]
MKLVGYFCRAALGTRGKNKLVIIVLAIKNALIALTVAVIVDDTTLILSISN